MGSWKDGPAYAVMLPCQAVSTEVLSLCCAAVMHQAHGRFADQSSPYLAGQGGRRFMIQLHEEVRTVMRASCVAVLPGAVHVVCK
jgi:hypothetical protein